MRPGLGRYTAPEVFMRNSMGVALLAMCALLCALAIEAAPPQQGRQGQQVSANAGLPWAYGFGTPVVAAPPAGARGGGGGAPAAAPAPAPAEPAEDMEAPRKVAGSTQTFNLKEVG